MGDGKAGRIGRALLLAGLLALLAGCGFQLRRELALPATLNTLRIEIGNPYTLLGNGLERALRRAGATLTDNADAAVLRIPVARFEQVPLSVSATGQVQEYALRYVVEFELLDAERRVVVPRQQAELERVVAFDSASALGSPDEQEIVRGELERDMVAAVLRRIDAALRAPAVADGA